MKHTFLAALSLCAVASCSSLSTNFDYDTSYSFTNLATYDWTEKETEIATLEARRVRAAVDAELAARGFKQSATKPDFQVAAHVKHQEKVEVQSWGYSYRPHSAWYGEPSVDLYEYSEGSLVIDVIDPAKHELVWRGTASKVIDEDWTPQEREEEIRAAVKALLASFPPKK